MLTKTLTPRGRMQTMVLGVRRVAIKRVAAIHKAREAARGKGLVGLGRCAGDSGANLLQRALPRCGAQEIFGELVHGRAVAGFLCEEFVDVDPRIKIGLGVDPAGEADDSREGS